MRSLLQNPIRKAMNTFLDHNKVKLSQLLRMAAPMFQLTTNNATTTIPQGYMPNPSYQAPPVKPFQRIPRTDQVNLLSYNIFMRPPFVQNSNNDYKDARLREFTKSFNQYDIICLQEMFGAYSRRRSTLVNHANEAGFLYNAQSPRPQTFSPYVVDAGLVVLSRHKILASEFRPFPQGVGVDFFAQKGILYTKIQVGEAILHLYTTHTQATYDKTSRYLLKRTEQFLSFQKFIKDTLSSHGYHNNDLVLLTGDFNVNAMSQRRFKSDDPELASILRECQELQNLESFTEYDALISCLKNNCQEEVEDLLLKTYKEHPITFGDFYFNELNEKKPMETVLSCRQEFKESESLDYIFKYIPKEAKQQNRPLMGKDDMNDQRLVVVDESTVVEKFFVKDQEFTQLSDHYGVKVTLKCAADNSNNENENAEQSIIVE